MRRIISRDAFARDKFAGDKADASRAAGPVDADQVFMLQRNRRAHGPQKTRGSLTVVKEVGPKNLERDGTIVSRVARVKNDSAARPGDDRLDAIPQELFADQGRDVDRLVRRLALGG